MQRRSRKSINPRESFYLPRHSDVVANTQVNADQLQYLQDISVVARPSLMPSPDGGPVIPENSDVTSAELKRRFPNDPEWYKRLPKFSWPSFTPRAQTKRLRRPDVDDAAEVSSDLSEEQSSLPDTSLSSRKPFRKKKQLFSKTQDFEKVLNDTTFIEKESLSEGSSRGASKVSVATRRSNRLALHSKIVADPVSPVESPRENFRRWKSASSQRSSSTLAEAFQELRATNAIIDESSESSSASIQPKSSTCGGPDSASEPEAERNILKLGIPIEENKEVSASEASFPSPPVRSKPFGKARKSRFSIGAVLDDISDSAASAAQSPRTTSNSPLATTEDVSSLEDNARPKLFAGKEKEKRRGSSPFGRIMDADDSQQTADESRGAERSSTKSTPSKNPASSIGSRKSVAEESPMFANGHKPFAKISHKQRGSSAFADALEAEDSHAFSAAETEIVGGSPRSGNAAAVEDGPPSVANDSPNRLRGQLSSSSAVGVACTSNVSSKQGKAAETVDHVSPGVVEVGPESVKSSSLTERRGRKSRRSSAFVPAVVDNQPRCEVAQKEDPCSPQSSPKRRRLEQEVSSPAQDIPLRSGARQRGWVVAKEKRRMDELDEILSMDTSSIDCSSNNKENDPDDYASKLDKEAMPVTDGDFVVPAIPSKRSSLQDRLSKRGTPRVNIVPLSDGAVSSTPTPNAPKMVVLSPMSSIAKLSLEHSEDPTSDHSKEAMIVVPPQSSPKNTRIRPSGTLDKSRGDQDCSVENGQTEDTSLPKEKQTRLSQKGGQARRSGDNLMEDEGLSSDPGRVLTSYDSKSPPKRKSTTSELIHSRRQSSRQITRSGKSEEFYQEKDGNEDLLSTTERALTSLNSKSPPKRKSTASEQLQKRRQSSGQMARSLSAEKSSEEDDLPSTAERALTSLSSKSSPKRNSTASEQSQQRRQSSRQMARSVNAEISSEDDLPSTAERALTFLSSKSSPKRKSTASQQSQKRRWSSREMARFLSTEKSSEEENENLPSTAESVLTSPSSMSSPKRNSTASEQSQQRRQSSRQMARSVNAEISSEDDLPSTAERALTSPSSKSSPKRMSTASQQSQKRRASSRQMARSVNAEISSEDDLPSTAERALTSPSSKSSPKRKSTASEQSQKRRRSSRQMARFLSTEKSEEENENLPSTAESVLTSPSSMSPPKRKSTASEQSQKRRQSSRHMARSLNAQKSSEDDLPSTAEGALTSLRSKPSPKRKSTASEQPQKGRQSSRQTTRSLSADFTEEKYDENQPSSAERILTPPNSESPSQRKSSPSNTVEQSGGEEDNAMSLSPSTLSFRRLDSSRKTSNRVDQTRRTLPKQTFTDGENSRQSGSSSQVFASNAVSVRDAKSFIGDPKDSEEGSNQRPASSVVERKLSGIDHRGENITATGALQVLPAGSISLNPSRSLIGVSSKSAIRKLSEGTVVVVSKEGSQSKITGTGNVADWEDTSLDEDAHDEVNDPSRPKDDREERSSAIDRPKRQSSVAAAATLREGAAMPPPPKKSVLPQRVRSDIRSYFVKSTPLKEHHAGDVSDVLVPLNATAITPIKRLGELSAGGSLFSQEGSSTFVENPPDEELDPKVGVAPRPTTARVQEIVEQLMERAPRKKEEAVKLLPQRVRVLPKLNTKSPQKQAKKTFQLILPDGKVYKQPKLPKPRKFVSDKMYRFITKNIKNNTQLDTRVRAEEFVRRLCDTYDRVLRRKNTKELVDELLKDMVRLGLVSTYAEFYYFVEKFLPFSFRMKAIPCIGSDLAPKPMKGIHEKLEFD